MPPKQSKNSKFELLIKEITTFEDNIKACDTNSVRIKILKTKVQEFETRMKDIFDQLTSNESDDHFEDYVKYKNILMNWNIELESKIPDTENSNVVNSANPVNSKNYINLPKFDIPTFYGNNETWLSFREIFKSAILDNDSLDDVSKLTYLQASVKGDAAKLIRGFSVSAENLKHCWELLCSRYENRRQLAICQINKIFHLKLQKANTSKLLLEMIDVCNESMRNLKSLGLEENKLTDLIIINALTAKLEDSVLQRWELQLEADSFPSLEDFKKFVEKEARSINDNKIPKSEIKKFSAKTNTNNAVPFRKSSVNNTIVDHKNDNNANLCVVCNQTHALFKCPTFMNMTITNRWNVVKEKKLCANCLRGNHLINQCRISISCKNCAARHHTLLHNYAVNNQTPSSDSVSVSHTITNTYSSSSEKNVLLSTALVKLKSPNGKVVKVRALIDSASQNCLIARQCADMLALPLTQSTHRLVGINQTCAETSLFSTNFEVSAYFNNDFFNVNALVVSKVTAALPNFKIENRQWPHLHNLVLADPSYFVEDEIELLLGADIFMSLITGTPILGPPGTPSALPTQLGHLLSGAIDTSTCHQQSSVVCHTISTLDTTLKKFWELESVTPPIVSHDVDELCEMLYSSSVQRTKEGRYIVKLPLKEDKSLGNSHSGALRRFYSLEKKIRENTELGVQYKSFMDEYASLNHMTKLNSSDFIHQVKYFLPHHAVTNEHSSTTKLRVVFDASFKSSNHKSLNDILLTGPKLQTNIFDNLLRFRSYPVAFTADIAKMYRQILIAEEDRDYQCILWRSNSNDPLDIYVLNTITYGTACAPFLALRTLLQLCRDEQIRYPKAAEIAREHFYVDDLLAGDQSVEAAINTIRELNSLLLAGGFPLRKWASSHPEVLTDIPEGDKANQSTHLFQPEHSERILGIFWNVNNDTIQVRTVGETNINSKRQLLSVIAQTYDPLGLVSPATLILKLMMKKLWQNNAGWDDSIPPDILETWSKFQSEIHHCREVWVPRYMSVAHATRVELHGFCDASQNAYAAVAYFRIFSEKIHMCLVAAKSRVAPMKEITLPKLELSGAMLLAKLITAIKNSVKFSIDEEFLWCDSTITLGWINNPPTKGNPFVAHRVTEIRKLTVPETWRHIPGKSNPADCASRGLFPLQLKNHSEWWEGPTWLLEIPDVVSVPTQITHISNDDSPSNSQDIQVEVSPSSFTDIITQYSSYTKLIRVFAWVKRFIQNCRVQVKNRDPLSASELDTACKSIIKIIQQAEFAKELKLLKLEKPLPKSSKLLSLNVFIDSEQILRVGGRLRKHPTMTFDSKHPMLIPKNHPFTSAVIRHYHLNSLHAGQELVLSLIRQKFWIPDGKSAVRKILRKCINCFQYSAQPIHQTMGDLPRSRIMSSRPFASTGIDFAGPILTKCQHTRKSSHFKSYICLFICMCTKAVHLELVSSLSTAAFLATFRRFIARRGYPREMFSDNATNFVGASAYLKELVKVIHHPSLQDYASQHQITWHFIPPYSPNFGGLWEASIKLTKAHLMKTCKGAVLNFEELTTLLCQIEACINSRPLYPLSADIHDDAVLTPGHFLIGCPLLELPESHDNTNHILSSHSRWKLLLQMKERFWNRWKTSYLHYLQPRTKWLQNHHLIKPGMLVLIKEPTSPATCWHRGRIIEIHPGTDGICRTVTVQTSRAVVKRAVSSISILPIQE